MEATKNQQRTYFKRKRGILKKCIEMSTKCHQDVFMVIYDKKNQTLVEFNSTPNFDIDEVMWVKLKEHSMSYQLYGNADLKLLESSMTPK